MKPLLTLRSAFDDPHLLGAVMGGPTREAMRALLLASQGEELTESEREHFRRLTGRDHEPGERTEETHIIAGRRSGKSSGCAALAVYAAALCDFSDHLSPGERGIMLLLAENQRQARVLLNYISGAFDASAVLSRLIVNRTQTTLALSNNIDIEVRAADYRGLRGLTLIAALCDEIAFWRSEDSSNPDFEVIEAIRPGLVTTQGQLLSIGSPYAKRGFQFSTFSKHYGPAGDPRVLVAKGATRDFNETVPQETIDRAIERDPESAASEWLGEFRNDISAFISREVVEACVVPDRFELPHVAGKSFCAFCDPSGGTSDSFTLAIATTGDEGVIVLACLREYRAPFSPDAVVEEIAATLRSYRIHRVTGDRYGGSWVAERFKEHGIDYIASEKNKNALYADALPLLNSRRVELLDDPRLVAQLCNLERRTSRGGRDSIDHPPGSHDDVANAACGALVLASAATDTLTALADFLDHGEPVRAQCLLGIFASLVVGADGEGAFVIWGRATVGPALVLMDFDCGPFSQNFIADMRSRVLELQKQHRASVAVVFTTDDILRLVNRDAETPIFATSLGALPDAGSLAPVASFHASRNSVKISEGALMKAEKHPLGAALSLSFGEAAGPLQTAIVLGICAALEPA